MGENSSLIFTVSVKSVSLYHLKFAYVVLHMAVKEFFEFSSSPKYFRHAFTDIAELYQHPIPNTNNMSTKDIDALQQLKTRSTL